MKAIRWAQGFAVLILLCVNQASASDYRNDVEEANRLYEDGHFQESAEKYQDILSQGHENGHLHYNLGNALLRSGQLGPAIFSYLKARHWLPRNEDVQANLNFALRQSEDKVDISAFESWRTYFFWITRFTAKEFGYMLVLGNLCLWMIWGLHHTFHNPILGRLRWMILAVVGCTLLSAGLRSYWEAHWNYGVVTAERAKIFSNPRMTSSEVVLELHEGAVVLWEERKDNSVSIRLADGTKGWAKLQNIEVDIRS